MTPKPKPTKTEFNLSEKINTFNEKRVCKIAWEHFIYVKDVKQAIRLLKEEFRKGDQFYGFITKIEKKINKIFGDKLTGENK